MSLPLLKSSVWGVGSRTSSSMNYKNEVKFFYSAPLSSDIHWVSNTFETIITMGFVEKIAISSVNG